jgi:hypothetical protein
MNRGEEDMTKTVLMNGAHLVLTQVALLICAFVLGYKMGWTPEYTASVAVGIQMGVGGWIVRGWFC